jgi:hypothetical protein
MSAGKIKELVDDVSFAQLDKLYEKLGIATEAMVKGISTAKQYNDAIGGAKTIPEFIENQAKATEAIVNVTKAQEAARVAEIKIQQAREKNIDDYNKKLEQQAAKESATRTKLQRERDAELAKQLKQADQQKKAEEQQAAAAEKAAKAEDERLRKVAISRRSYNELVLKTKDAIKNAQDIGADKGTNSVDFKDAQTNAEKYQKQLYAINNSLGDYKNQVGNYSKGIADYASKAFSGIRTLANIIPNFGIGTFFLLAYEGLKLLVEKLTEGKSAIDGFAASVKAYQAAFESSTFKDAISNVIDLKEQIKLQKEGTVDAELVINKYNETLGQSIGKVGTLTEVEQKLTDNSKNYIKSMFFKAAAAAALSQGTDDLVKATKNLATAQANLTLTQTDLSQIQKEIAKGGDQAEMYKGLLKMAENAKKADQQSLKDKQTVQDQLVNQTATIYDKLNQMANKFAAGFVSGGQQDIDTRRLNNASEVQKILLQKQVDGLEEVYGNEKNSYKKRENALIASTEIKKRILGVSLNEELSDVTLQADKKAVIQEQYNTDIEKLTIDQVKKQRELHDKSIKDELEYQNQKLQLQKKSAENIISDPDQEPQTKLDALQKYETASRQIIKNSENIAIQDAGANVTKIKTIKEKAAAELLEVNTDVNNKTAAIQRGINETLKKLFETGAKNQETALDQEIIDFKDAQDSKLLEIEQYKSEALKGLADQYSAGKISAAEYNQSIYDIDSQSAQERVQVQIDTVQKVINERKKELQFGIGSAKELQRAQDDLTKLQIQSSDLATKVEIDNALKLQAAKKNLFDLEKEFIYKSLDLIKSLVDGAYQNQLNALTAQSEQVAKNGQDEKTHINNSILSNQEKARQSSIVDAQIAQQQHQIAEDQKKIKKQEAEFDRIMSLAKIAEAIAIAEVQALTYLSNPFTAALYPAIATAIGAIGAVEIATVLATPLPKFEKGGTVKKDGPIITGEAGTELRIDPSGKTSFTADHANVTYAKAGTKIISNKELVAMLGKPEAVQYVSTSTNDNRRVEKLLAENNELQKRNKRPVVNIYGDRWGNYSNQRNY